MRGWWSEPSFSLPSLRGCYHHLSLSLSLSRVFRKTGQTWRVNLIRWCFPSTGETHVSVQFLPQGIPADRTHRTTACIKRNSVGCQKSQAIITSRVTSLRLFTLCHCFAYNVILGAPWSKRCNWQTMAHNGGGDTVVMILEFEGDRGCSRHDETPSDEATWREQRLAFGPVRCDGSREDDSPVQNGRRVIGGCTVFFSSCSPGGHVGTDVSPQFPGWLFRAVTRRRCRCRGRGWDSSGMHTRAVGSEETRGGETRESGR